MWNGYSLMFPAGCYQCSQRRIHCDRTQPSCGKCVSRGILCSGFGVRYRFCDGFGGRRRGRREYPVSDAFDSSGSFASSADYMNGDAIVGDSVSGSFRIESNDGMEDGQPRTDGPHPALAWRNSNGWERFLLEYCTYPISYAPGQLR